ncbi:ICE family protease (caspase) p20 domain-containing protein [Toxoplasma gondii GT1]|nr:ICE family protease (caspase) p20 domain-containing protein [Toxoplasma gondii GT1]
MAHVKQRLKVAILRVDGVEGLSARQGCYVKFRWRGDKYKTEAKKRAGNGMQFNFTAILPFDSSDPRTLALELWTAAAFSHKRVAETSLDLTRLASVSATQCSCPLTSVEGRRLGASPVLVLSVQLQNFDQAASNAELQQRLHQHAEEQRQRREFEKQQTVLEQRLLAGRPPPAPSPYVPPPPPAHVNPSSSSAHTAAPSSSYPPPYSSSVYSSPCPPGCSAFTTACVAPPPQQAHAGPAAPGPYANYPYFPGNSAYSPSPAGQAHAAHAGQAPQYGWAAPQQPTCVEVPPQAPRPSIQQATVTASGHWDATAIKYIKNILPQCSTQEIEEALSAAGGDREKAVDVLLKRLVAHAAEENETQVHQLEHQAAEAAQPVVAWTQYSAAPAAYGAPPGGPMALETPPTHAPPHLGFTPAPMYTPVGKIPSSGRRKALLVGINYRGTDAELRGCVNDVHRMKNLLCSVYGFHDSSTTLVALTDDSRNSLYRPTRNNILKAMHWLTIDNRPGDALFFHFSGHGGREIDRSGIEEDGYDETILPVDFETAGQILDDELHAFLVQPLQSGCRLTAVMDCCHSGTGLDLPFTWNSPKWRWDEETNPFYVLGDVQMFSGCQDDQTSADLAGHEDRAPGGAMTTAFIAVLTARPFGHSYPSLMQGLTESMVSRGLSQRPQLTSSQKFDFNRPFNLSDVIPNQNRVLGRQIRRRRKPLPNSESRRRPGAGIGDAMLLAGAGLATGLLVGSLLND